MPQIGQSPASDSTTDGCIGQVHMDHKAHFGLIDPHPEGIGGHHNADTVFSPVFLPFITVLLFQTSMIE